MFIKKLLTAISSMEKLGKKSLNLTARVPSSFKLKIFPNSLTKIYDFSMIMIVKVLY